MSLSNQDGEPVEPNPCFGPKPALSAAEWVMLVPSPVEGTAREKWDTLNLEVDPSTSLGVGFWLDLSCERVYT